MALLQRQIRDLRREKESERAGRPNSVAKKDEEEPAASIAEISGTLPRKARGRKLRGFRRSERRERRGGRVALFSRGTSGRGSRGARRASRIVATRRRLATAAVLKKKKKKKSGSGDLQQGHRPCDRRHKSARPGQSRIALSREASFGETWKKEGGRRKKGRWKKRARERSPQEYCSAGRAEPGGTQVDAGLVSRNTRSSRRQASRPSKAA